MAVYVVPTVKPVNDVKGADILDRTTSAVLVADKTAVYDVAKPNEGFVQVRYRVPSLPDAPRDEGAFGCSVFVATGELVPVGLIPAPLYTHADMVYSPSPGSAIVVE